MNIWRKHFKGFTLIELLIVIAIIGILAVAFLPALTSGTAKARDAARKAAVGDIVAAVESIITDGGTEPVGTICLDFTTGPGQTIAQETKKIPKDYASSITSPQLCVAGSTSEYFYNSALTSNGNYVVGVEMELDTSANVEEGVAASTIISAVDGDILLGYTDADVGNGEVVGGVEHYYYIVVK